MEKRCERPNSAAAFTRKPGVRVSFMQGEADQRLPRAMVDKAKWILEVITSLAMALTNSSRFP